MATNRTKITLFKDETADKLLQNIPGTTTTPVPSGTLAPNTGFQKEEQYEIITVKIISEDGNGYYTADEVIFDDSDADPTVHDFQDKPYLRKDITVRETSGDSTVAVDTIVKVAPEGKVDKTVIWSFTRGGGGSSTSVVHIISSLSENEYLGFLQDSPDPATRSDIGSAVTIKPIVTLSATLQSGSFYTAFLEADVYWISNLAVFN